MPNDDESVGELEVRGPWVTQTYIGDAEPDPEKFRDGWLRTGDVGMLSVERLPHADRPRQGRHQVRRRVDLVGRAGEPPDGAPRRCSRRASSACRTRSGPSARSRPSSSRRARRSRAEELRDFLGGRIARWQLPERWAFIDAVPKTSVGKFDKKVIRSRYADGDLSVKMLG